MKRGDERRFLRIGDAAAESEVSCLERTERMKANKRPTKELVATAYHEAGHAVVAILNHRRFRHVTIEPGERTLGHVLFVKWRGRKPDASCDAGTTRRTEVAVLCTCAGPAAEARLRGRRNRIGAEGDDRHSASMAASLCGSMEETCALLKLLSIRAKQEIELPWVWRAIEGLAAQLLVRRRIGYATAKNIVRRLVDEPGD
jgi:hypothetical protein